MYNYEWDIETGGYILLPTKITGVTKELRPVFYDELHLLGVDRDYGWIIPNAENPLMWAEGRRYFYRGELVAEATGGGLFSAPVLKNVTRNISVEPVDIHRFVDKNENILNGLVQRTLKDLYATFEEYKLYQQHNAIDEVFRDILSAENMRAGMNYYIAQYKPELIQIASNLKVDAKEYLELLNSKLSNDSSYLWELGDTNRQIDNLYIDLKLIYDINRLFVLLLPLCNKSSMKCSERFYRYKSAADWGAPGESRSMRPNKHRLHILPHLACSLRYDRKDCGSLFRILYPVPICLVLNARKTIQ